MGEESLHDVVSVLVSGIPEIQFTENRLLAHFCQKTFFREETPALTVCPSLRTSERKKRTGADLKGKDYFLSFFNSPPSEEKNKKLTRVFLTDAAAAVVARIVVATPTDSKHHCCVGGS